jgi:hypothetical protein
MGNQLIRGPGCCLRAFKCRSNVQFDLMPRPPGRARLATRPSLTGSSPTPNTIGIVAVAALAAIASGAVIASIAAAWNVVTEIAKPTGEGNYVQGTRECHRRRRHSPAGSPTCVLTATLAGLPESTQSRRNPGLPAGHGEGAPCHSTRIHSTRIHGTRIHGTSVESVFPSGRQLGVVCWRRPRCFV